MREENAIEVKNIQKSFKVYYDKSHNLKEKALFWKRNHYEERKVLRGISFDVKRGEAVGLIGHNGCGKSTTLKLLTRIIYPDAGSIKMKGRVSSLIELGAGFHPDMSGRENIYTNAAIFGLTKKEIDARLEDIIEFSELEEFIDNPVRTYSSGMYMRLAFSVAINVDADILLIDEILAVGDIAFQAKCFNKLKEIKAAGTTIVLVSHSLGQVEQLCDTSIWINDGEIVMKGTPREVHPCYLDYMGKREHKNTEKVEDVKDNSKKDTSEQENVKDKNRYGNGDAQIVKIHLIDSEGKEKKNFASGEKMKIRVSYTTKKQLEDVVFGIGIFSIDDRQIFGTNTFIDGIKVKIGSGGVMECVIESLPLGQGEYKLDVAIHTSNNFNYDYWRDACRFQVYTKLQEAGVLHMERTWNIE